ncbi:hypothetical protein Tco_1109800, partial [Tanacetum coccineum]
PEVMDQALFGRGRLGTKLYVPLPNPDEPEKKQLDTDVDLVAFGQSNACANFCGADLYALVSEAANAARQERISKIKAAKPAAVKGTPGSFSQSIKGGMRRMLKAAHLDQALRKISPSVSEEVLVTSILCHVLIMKEQRYMGELGDISKAVPVEMGYSNATLPTTAREIQMIINVDYGI